MKHPAQLTGPPSIEPRDIPPSAVVFLHGLESPVDASGVPMGKKATYLRDAFQATLPALDTSEAQKVAGQDRAFGGWRYPYEGYEAAFATPLSRARAALGAQARVIVGSSFGGAVALRLLHEPPRWTGAVILLAGAGPKLTPYDRLPAGIPVLLVHGRRDEVVPLEDSERLAASSPDAELLVVEDDHGLGSVVEDRQLGRWVCRAFELARQS